MAINVQKYKDIYEWYNEKVNLACNCIESNPCIKVSSTIGEMVSFLNNQIKLLTDWDDSAKKAFVENMEICIGNLEKIKESIDTNWKTAEEKYLALKENLSQLKTNYEFLEQTIKNKPQRDSYRKNKYDEMGNVIDTTYPGYDSALNIWQKRCDQQYSKCEELYGLLVEDKAALNDINKIVLSIQQSALISIENLPKQEIKTSSEDINFSLNPNKELPVQYTTTIPDNIKQSAYTVTCYEADGWHFGASSKGSRVGVGTGQRAVHEAWNAQGSNYENGIAVIDDNGTSRYLVACSSEIGKVGDRLTYRLENGQTIEALVADQKSSGDRNYSQYGHVYNSGTNILEFEVNTQDYREKGNPTTEKWGLNWDSSSRIVSIDNHGSAKGDLIKA